MNYLDAKTVLLQSGPRVPLKLYVVEAVALICLTTILVFVFA